MEACFVVACICFVNPGGVRNEKRNKEYTLYVHTHAVIHSADFFEIMSSSSDAKVEDKLTVLYRQTQEALDAVKNHKQLIEKMREDHRKEVEEIKRDAASVSFPGKPQLEGLIDKIVTTKLQAFAKKVAAAINNKFAAAVQRSKTNEKSVSDLETTLNDWPRQLQVAVYEPLNDLTTKVGNLQKMFEESKREVDMTKAIYGELETRLEAVREETKENDDASSETERLRKVLESRCEDFEKRLNDMKQKNNLSEDKQKTTTKDLQKSIHDSVEMMSSKYENLEKRLNDMKQQNSSSEENLLQMTFDNSVEMMRTRFEDLESRLYDMKEKNNETKTQQKILEDSRRDVNLMRSRCEELERRLDDAVEEKMKVNDEIVSLLKSQSELKKLISEQSETIATMKRSQDDMIEKFRNQKENSNVTSLAPRTLFASPSKEKDADSGLVRTPDVERTLGKILGENDNSSSSPLVGTPDVERFVGKILDEEKSLGVDHSTSLRELRDEIEASNQKMLSKSCREMEEMNSKSSRDMNNLISKSCREMKEMNSKSSREMEEMISRSKAQSSNEMEEMISRSETQSLRQFEDMISRSEAESSREIQEMMSRKIKFNELRSSKQMEEMVTSGEMKSLKQNEDLIFRSIESSELRTLKQIQEIIRSGELKTLKQNEDLISRSTKSNEVRISKQIKSNELRSTKQTENLISSTIKSNEMRTLKQMQDIVRSSELKCIQQMKEMNTKQMEKQHAHMSRQIEDMRTSMSRYCESVAARIVNQNDSISNEDLERAQASQLEQLRNIQHESEEHASALDRRCTQWSKRVAKSMQTHQRRQNDSLSNIQEEFEASREMDRENVTSLREQLERHLAKTHESVTQIRNAEESMSRRIHEDRAHQERLLHESLTLTSRDMETRQDKISSRHDMEIRDVIESSQESLKEDLVEETRSFTESAIKAQGKRYESYVQEFLRDHQSNEKKQENENMEEDAAIRLFGTKFTENLENLESRFREMQILESKRFDEETFRLRNVLLKNQMNLSDRFEIKSENLSKSLDLRLERVEKKTSIWREDVALAQESRVCSEISRLEESLESLESKLDILNLRVDSGHQQARQEAATLRARHVDVVDALVRTKRCQAEMSRTTSSCHAIEESLKRIRSRLSAAEKRLPEMQEQIASTADGFHQSIARLSEDIGTVSCSVADLKMSVAGPSLAPLVVNDAQLL